MCRILKCTEVMNTSLNSKLEFDIGVNSEPFMYDFFMIKPPMTGLFMCSVGYSSKGLS